MGRKEINARWYQRHKAAHRARTKAERIKVAAENYRLRDEYLKQHPCVDCGEDDIEVLTFDHVRGKKHMDVSAMVLGGYRWPRILTEIAKCAVRCWNCHMRRTFRLKACADSSTGRALDS